MQSNRARGMEGVLVSYCSPPKVKKQSKQKRQSGLDNDHRELKKEKEERRVCLKGDRV